MKMQHSSNPHKRSLTMVYGLWSVVMILCLNIFGLSGTFANNLTIANISYSQVNGTVTFDLSWNNSWRSSTTSAANWDAAWVFVKWRDCSASSAVQFTHGLVSVTTTDHNFNVASGATTYQPTKRDGTVGIDVSPDN